MTVELTRITATGASPEAPYRLNLGVDNRSSDNHLVYLTNYYQLDRNRSGTSSFKSKKDVRGGGRKLYKQKGTGRARKGGSRSPLIRGGGKAFGRSARDLSSDLPKKVIQLGIKTTLKLNQDKLCILDKPDTYTQTKSWRGVFDKTKQYLCIINTIQSVLTCMNYPNVTYCYVDGLSVQSILKADQIIIIDDALKIFEELYCVRD